MDPAYIDSPFFTVTLPMMLTILGGTWAVIANNRRLDKKRTLEERLAAIESERS